MILIFIFGCKEEPKPNASGDQGAEIAIPEDKTDVGEVSEVREFCFVQKSPARNATGQGFNYEFIHFTVTKGDKARGTFLSSPYGTDGARGSLSGIYRGDQNLLQTTTTFLAEGEYYEEQRDYKIGADGISLQGPSGEPVLTIPAVSCEEYTAELKAYRQGILKNSVNTTDRSRLKKVKEVIDFGYTPGQLDSLRFMEREIDLDNDYRTREFLLFIMDPMVCGSGGRNLMIIDETGKTLSSTTVVKLPVFTVASTVGDLQSEGSWKPLFVWSQGYRKLSPADGKYPSNASMAPEVPQGELEGHPENYQLLLDYLD